MKYRIIERGDGKFKVQSRVHWWGKWEDEYNYSEDYPGFNSFVESPMTDDWRDRVFSSVDLAQSKIKKLRDERQAEQLKKQFKVVEEVEV